MKTIYSGILCLLCYIPGVSGQAINAQFEMPVYFEDAIGNKDTLIIGYNSLVPPPGVYNPSFDGPLVLGPMDSVFEVRAFHVDNSFHVNQFTLKKIIVQYENLPSDSCGVSADVDIIVSCKYPPLTVRYDSTVLGPTSCRSNAILSPDWQIFLLQYWWQSPKYICMGEQSEVTFADINKLYEHLKVENVEVEGQGERDLPGLLIVFHQWGACTDSTLVKISEAIQLKKPEMRVSPNPSGGNLHISVNTAAAYSNGTMRLVDVLGKTVRSKSVALDQGNNTIQWDLQHLRNGFYWLEFMTGKGSTTVPVIIQE